jgi:hypothetical protein
MGHPRRERCANPKIIFHSSSFFPEWVLIFFCFDLLVNSPRIELCRPINQVFGWAADKDTREQSICGTRRGYGPGTIYKAVAVRGATTDL